MRRVINLLVVVLGFAASPVSVKGQEPPEVRSPEAAVPAGQGEPVSIQVALVEYLAAGQRDVGALRSPEEIDAWIGELGDARKLLAVTKLEISTIDGRQAMTQFGERASVASGRTRVAPARAGRGGFGGQPVPAVVNSYQFVEIGTIVRATPRLCDDGTIAIELQVEKSDISPLTPQMPPDEEGRVDVAPPNVVNLTLQSTLRLKDGQSHAAYRKGTSSPQGMVETIIFVTAQVANDAADLEGLEESGRTSNRLKAFQFKSVDATDAIKALQKRLQWSESFRMEIGSHSNSLLAYGSPEELESIGAILQELDGDGDSSQ